MCDALTYTLNGNQMIRVDDLVSIGAGNDETDFKDAVKQANEYTYDANGNLTKDLNKGITGITYNCLNLPNAVTFSDGSTITYIYSADGTKLRTVHKIGSVTTTTDYCGNVIYENNTAKLLLTGEGYISLSDKKYHYYLQDHQGNNRVVVDKDGNVKETNHYYPFGGVFASTGSVQPYKYNSKELDTKKGLNWYDYGARMYDPALGRWHVVDPLAEKYCGVSPYTYCKNNPILRIDIDGKDDYVVNKNGYVFFWKNTKYEDKGEEIIMKKRSFTLLMSALTISATLIGTSPVAAKIDTDTATEETTDKEETTAKDADSENTDNKETDASKSDTLEDGTYTAEFDTDSGMFHVNEANDGKGTLTVKDGKMTIHVSLASKKIVNLFVGKAEDAQKDGAEVLEPTTDTVTYSDGMSEEVYGFDIPVPAIDEEFDVALIGTKGKWYDHKVSVKNPVKSDDTDAKKDDKENKDADSKADDTDKDAKDSKTSEGKTLADLNLEDGDYTMDVTLTGGSGRATIDSPAAINVEGDKATATIVWSSPNYDYMLVDGEKYEPVNKDGNSTFEIPVSVFDAEMEVTADTVAMSEPHEIDYTLNFDSTTAKEAEKTAK